MKRKIIKLINLAKENGYNLCNEIKIGDNIIIPATSEEEEYYVLFNSIWYVINLETNKFYQNDFGGDYYKEWFLTNK